MEASPAQDLPRGQFDVAQITRQLTEDLASGRTAQGTFVDGRIVSVIGSPGNGVVADMAFGFSAIPAGLSTAPHSHRAEELAIVVQGHGRIEVDEVSHVVSAGSIVVTPPNSVHVTRAEGNSPLVVLWVYAPPGSESRWLPQ